MEVLRTALLVGLSLLFLQATSISNTTRNPSAAEASFTYPITTEDILGKSPRNARVRALLMGNDGNNNAATGGANAATAVASLNPVDTCTVLELKMLRMAMLAVKTNCEFLTEMADPGSNARNVAKGGGSQ